MHLSFKREKLIRIVLLVGGLLTLVNAGATLFMQDSAAEASASHADNIVHLRSMMTAGASMTTATQAAGDLGLHLSLDSALYPPIYSISHTTRSPEACEHSVVRLLDAADKVLVGKELVVRADEAKLSCSQATDKRIEVAFFFKD